MVFACETENHLTFRFIFDIDSARRTSFVIFDYVEYCMDELLLWEFIGDIDVTPHINILLSTY